MSWFSINIRVCVLIYVFHVAFICRRATMQHDKHLSFLGLVAQELRSKREKGTSPCMAFYNASFSFSFSTFFQQIMAPIITPEVTSSIQWLAQMNVNVELEAVRKSTIIGTIGEKTPISNRIYDMHTDIHPNRSQDKQC